jgi:hypothetical protein
MNEHRILTENNNVLREQYYVLVEKTIWSTKRNDEQDGSPILAASKTCAEGAAACGGVERCRV